MAAAASVVLLILSCSRGSSDHHGHEDELTAIPASARSAAQVIAIVWA